MWIYLDQKESIDAFTQQCEGRELNRLFRAMDERELLSRFSSFLTQPETPVRRVADRLQVYVYSQDQALDLDRYLYEELELVRSAFRCYDDYKDYLAYERDGRTIQFQGARRDAVLEILKAWETHQLSNAFLDHMGLCQVALLAVDEANAIPDKMRYRSVLVDDLKASELSGDYTLKSQEIVVSDIASIKGFEFSMIIVLGMDEGMMPPKGRPEAERWRDALRLYVAITRGRDEVRFIYTTTPSPFLESMREHVLWETAAVREVELPITKETVNHLGKEESEDTQASSESVELENGLIESAPVELDTQLDDADLEIEVLPQDNDEIPAPSATPVDSTPEIIVLNGIPIVPIPFKASQFQLARALSTQQREISLKCQLELHHFTDPHTPLPEHIILLLCQQYGVVPNLIK